MKVRRSSKYGRLVLAPLIAVALGATSLVPSRAQAEPMREFIMSCSYGVLAGTLVGAATLAFSDKPGENLNKVARGASIGLYAGILLGLYVVYGVPSGQGEDDASLAGANDDLFQRSLLSAGTSARTAARYGLSSAAQMKSILPEAPRLIVAPVIGERGLEGASAQFAVMKF